ncbi:HU family DNA-binding protein [Persephonella sp.]
MTKADIVEWILENKNLEVTKKDISEVVNAIFDKIIDELTNGKDGHKVQISGFGTFTVKKRAPKIGRNPKTKEEKLIPARLGISFKAGKHLKESLSR